jgi:hypothetical protein
MVDVERTAREVLEIYRHALGLGDAPPEFDPAEALHEALHESMELTV